MANCITGARIILSIILLFCPALTPAFFIIYILAGVTDILDGFVARMTNTISEFGSKFDTAADFVFVLAAFIKILPVLNIPLWVDVWVAIIAIIKIVVVNFIYGDAIHGRYVAIHNIANKLTGIFLFLLPLTIEFININFSIIFVSAFATVAAIIEWVLVKTKKA